MAAQARAAFGQIIRSVARAAHATLTDRELLRRYADDGDQAAFAALVARHTGMVLGVFAVSVKSGLAWGPAGGCSASFELCGLSSF